MNSDRESTLPVIEDPNTSEVTEDNEQGFDMTVWAQTCGINRKTTGVLRKEDIVSKDTLILLTEKDLMELGLSLGQRKLVAAAIGRLKASVGEEPKQTNKKSSEVETAKDSVTTIMDVRQQTSQLQLAGKTFDNLFTNTVTEDKTSTPAHPLAEQCIVNSPSFVYDPSDPRTVLTVKSTSKKAVHITQFLSERTKKRCQSRKKGFVIATSVNDENLVLKQEDEHPYSGITMDEWSAANCRLMSYLIHSGELLSSDVDYYLAYSTQIYDWAGKYKWEALLDFDFQYRERQAQHGFKWGSLTANMELQLLGENMRSREIPNFTNSGRSSSQKHSKFNKKPENEECRQFKARNGLCSFGDNCRYRHVLPGGAYSSNLASKNGQ